MRTTWTENKSEWTGAFISESGEVLTTSLALGNAPVVDIQTSDGTQGQACVTGRDDDIGLALLKPLIKPPHTHHFLALSAESPSVGDGLLLIQHSGHVPDTQTTHVTSYEPFDSGFNYFQVMGGESAADGAVLINNRGELQGMRMPQLWGERQGIGTRDGVYAVDSADIAGIALPLLRSGHIHIDIVYPLHFWPLAMSPRTELVSTTPPLLRAGGTQAASHLLPNGRRWSPPASIGPLYTGHVTINGAPAPVGSILYARVSKEGQPDYWTSETIWDPGFFLMMILVPTNHYVGATIEFWMDCRRSITTATYDFDVATPTARLDLNF